MLPHEPQEWPRLFEQALEAGDLEAVVGLYEPDARFVARPGETLVGRDRIRDVLAGLIRAKTRLRGRVRGAGRGEQLGGRQVVLGPEAHQQRRIPFDQGGARHRAVALVVERVGCSGDTDALPGGLRFDHRVATA